MKCGLLFHVLRRLRQPTWLTLCLALQIYAGPLAGGARAVVLLNLHTTGGQYLSSNITVTWQQLGLPAHKAAEVRDLYVEQDLGQATGSFTAVVHAHDVRVLRISPVGGMRGDTWRPWHQPPVVLESARRRGAAGGRRAGPKGEQAALFAGASLTA